MSTKPAKRVKKEKDPTALKETKEQVLLRLANFRVPKAVKYILYIGNLATYKPTDQDVANIMGALAAACEAVENRLRGAKVTVSDFKLTR